MKIITVSREFGSGGRELGKRLSDCLGADLESWLRRCRERSSDDERFTLRELERKLRQVDQHRARHHAMLSDLPWGSQEGYLLCVNTTGLSLKTLAPLVAEYARSWFSHQGTP